MAVCWQEAHLCTAGCLLKSSLVVQHGVDFLQACQRHCETSFFLGLSVVLGNPEDLIIPGGNLVLEAGLGGISLCHAKLVAWAQSRQEGEFPSFHSLLVFDIPTRGP